MIKDRNIADDAMIGEHKLNIFGSTGVKKLYVGTDGTPAYELATSRVNDADLFTTLDAAINAATTNRSDRIHVLPGHAETLASAGAVAADIDGLEVICHGYGDQRPTFTFSDTASSILVTGASFTMKNFIITPSVDSVTNPLHIQADDCTLDFEVRDASASVEFVRAILTTADADKLKANIKYRGFIAGNACVNVARLVGCDGADIVLDFYGKASTALVEFHTTACHDVNVTGKTYLSGTTDGSKNVVDTVTGSTWYMDVIDEAAGSRYTGGSGSAIASDDVSSITDALYGANGIATYPSAAAPANNVSIAEVVRDIWDALRNGTGGAEPTTNRGIMDYLGASPAFFAPGLGFTVTKTCSLASANDDLFDITGKVLITLITGEVTTVLSGAESFQLRVKTDNIALCAATTIDSDADGTHYMLSGDFGDAMNGGSTPGLRAADVNSVGARGAFEVGDASGSAVIESNTTGNGGEILFTLCYIPLEAGASVTASA